ARCYRDWSSDVCSSDLTICTSCNRGPTRRTVWMFRASRCPLHNVSLHFISGVSATNINGLPPGLKRCKQPVECTRNDHECRYFGTAEGGAITASHLGFLVCSKTF